MVWKLSYSSLSLIDSFSAPMLDLARVALDKNARLNVTGALYFDGNHFFQVLEGEKPVLLDLFKTIAADKRHTAVSTPRIERQNCRMFPAWSMKFVDGGRLPQFRQCWTSDSMTDIHLAELEQALLSA